MATGTTPTLLPGVHWINIPHVRDQRGILSSIEDALTSFPIKRVFYMHQVPAGMERGGHAHPNTDQLIVAVSGSMRITVSAEATEASLILDDPARGLFVPRMTWTRLYDFSATAVILVLCNTNYVPSEVIRDPDEFSARRAGKR